MNTTVSKKINQDIYEGYPVAAIPVGMQIFRVVHTDPLKEQFFKVPYLMIGPNNQSYIIARSNKNAKFLMAIDSDKQERAFSHLVFKDNGDLFNPSDFSWIDKGSL